MDAHDRRLPQITDIGASALLDTVPSIGGNDIGKPLATAAKQGSRLFWAGGDSTHQPP